MKNGFIKLVLSASLAIGLFSVRAYSQAKIDSINYNPVIGQIGKDVVWVPTPQKLVDKMLDMAMLTAGDLLIDLGSGDGRTVISAAKQGTYAIGVEYNPEMVALSKHLAKAEGVGNMTEFVTADLFEYDFSKATVLTMFLLPDINIRLRPLILGMKPGTRVVSNTFTMDEWSPDDTVIIDDPGIAWYTAYMWIVPAKVEGRWSLNTGEDIVFLQKFQQLSGEVSQNGNREEINGKIRGYEISFHAGGWRYLGLVNGNSMRGTRICNEKTETWTARKKAVAAQSTLVVY